MGIFSVPADQLEFVRATLPDNRAQFSVGMPGNEIVVDDERLAGCTRLAVLETITAFLNTFPDDRKLLLPVLLPRPQRPLPGMGPVVAIERLDAVETARLQVVVGSWREIGGHALRLDHFTEPPSNVVARAPDQQPIRPYRPPVVVEAVALF